MLLKLQGVVAQLRATHIVASTRNVTPLQHLMPSQSIHDVALLDWDVAESQIERQWGPNPPSWHH